MKIDRVSRSVMQRTFAVVLAQAVLASSWSPVFAANLRQQGGLAAAPKAAAPAQLPSALIAGGLKAAPTPNISGPSATGLQGAASANDAAPAARTSLQGLSDSAQAADGRGASSESAKASQDASYDKRVTSTQDTEAIAGDWTSRPPSLPLATLKPDWQAAAAPTGASLKQSLELGIVDEPVAESGVTDNEKINFGYVAPASVIKDVTTDEEAIAFGLRQRFEISGGNKSAVQTKKGFAWIDARGDVLTYDRAGRSVHRATPPLGAAAEKLVASQDGAFLYVLAGGSVQRWNLETSQAAVVLDEKLFEGGVLEIQPQRKADGSAQGVDIRTPAGHVQWQDGKLGLVKSGAETISAETGAAPTLRDAGNGLYLETRGGSTRLWAREIGAEGAVVADRGSIPLDVKAAVASADGKTIFALTQEGFVEWSLSDRRFRLYSVERMGDATLGAGSLDVSADGRRALISAEGRFYYADLGAGSTQDESEEAEVRRWSEANPMFIRDGFLHIGEFKFAVKPRFAPQAAAPKWLSFLPSFMRGWFWTPAPAKELPAVSAEQWRALNLPSNKKAIYQTLKGFSLGQNVLYVGETGGGKTWIASMLGKLIGRKLYTVSFTEYTKNQDLLYSRTFGEEAAGKTGKTLETVLLWLADKEGGILLLDELHKPLEGIAALNNILQNRQYHFSGKDITGDYNKHFVIGTMNPARPPYKGEPPSGELASRFGTTLNVNYLPPAEEAALLSIFFDTADPAVARTLVTIAKELRKVYPDTLPLPISSRTLLNVIQHIAMYPGDDRIEIFKQTYNADVIVPDISVTKAIEKVLQAHSLGESKKKALN